MAIRDTGRVLNQLLETAKHCKVMRLHPLCLMPMPMPMPNEGIIDDMKQ